MCFSTIKQIISNGVFDPYSKKTIKFPIKEIGYNIISDIDSIIKYYNTSYLVADTTTIKLIDQKLIADIPHYVIPSDSVASYDLVQLIIEKAKNFDFIIALGSGTINDLCKYASYIDHKNYILFPTAASMNGYTSASASILIQGYKKSLQAHLPKAIYIDLNVLVNAPLRLTLSGFADFICRSTAQADWLLSHLLLNTKYNSLPFLLFYDIEQILLREYLGLAAKNKEVIILLMEALLLSGIGMVISEGSYPASQGEHMIAHAMEAINDRGFSLHGEKIAVTTLTMAYLQEKILSSKPIIKPTVVNEKEIFECFGAKHRDEFIEIFNKKKINKEKADYFNELINENWSEIVEKIKENYISSKVLKKIFYDLNMPSRPEDLGWNINKYKKVTNLAFATRDRFTFLDL